MAQKILIVDDREDNIISMETILEAGGYEIVKAQSGREALRILLKDFDFALILMDVNMPVLNGFETAALVYEREKLRHIPIIFITANNFGEENIFRGYRTGAVDYIYKPVNPELLRAKVSVFVELYKKNHQLILQEQKLISINKSLENEIKERIASEDQVKELNRRLIENIDQLESANRELDGFAFMASHDLREPLRKIQTFADILSTKYKQQFEENSLKYILSIQNNAKRMESLIKDLLSFSKVSNESEIAADCDLNIVLDEAIKDLETKISEKKVRLEIERLPTVPGNAGLLRSLFLNLLDNAIKYGRKEIEPAITVRSVKAPDEVISPSYCRIQIQDNGIGFEQKYADHIFTMFRRLHSTGEFEGTGIGLAICKKIVEKHHGFIVAQSEADKGTVFTISLPLEAKYGTTNFAGQTELTKYF